MRVLVVGPTGRTGSHVIAALRERDPSIEIRGLCRYPESRSRSIETIPGNVRRGGPIETVPGNIRRGGPIETIPGNVRRGGPIETIPGNIRRGGPIETIPGNIRRGGPIETIPGNIRRGDPIETIPGNIRRDLPLDGESEPSIAIEIAADGTAREREIEVELQSGVQTIACLCGDLENPADRAAAVDGMDAVIHYAPAFHPREAAMGTGMIDAAVAAGVTRFIYVSALHAQVASVPGNAAKLAVEGYLAESGLEWTVLRPQSYMQNIDVAAVLEDGVLELPFPLAARQGYLDLADLAEVVAKVAFEDGHALATYDLAGDEALGTAEIAALITTLSGRPVASGEADIAALVAGLEAAGPAYAYVAEAANRLNGWQARSGGRGNANVLRWLLGREPGRFEDYVRRSLEG